MAAAASPAPVKSPDDHKLTGRLTVTIHGCRDLYVHNFIGTPDPFAHLWLDDESYKTRVHKDGGSAPSWEQTFLFNPKGSKGSNHLKIEVINEGTLKNTVVARVDLNIFEALSKGSGKREYELRAENDFSRIMGFIAISCTFPTRSSRCCSAVTPHARPASAQLCVHTCMRVVFVQLKSSKAPAAR
jgi:hypothetical protein